MMTVELALRGAVLLGGGLVAARLLRAASATTRHALWRLVLLTVLLLPVVTAASPRWSVMDQQPSHRARALLTATSTALDVSNYPSPSDPRPGTTPESGTAGLPSRTAKAATLTWFAGAVSVFLFYLVGYLRLWCIRRRSTPAPLPWRSSASRLGSRLGLSTTPDVRTSPSASGPLVCGLWRASVLIPPDAADWPKARRDAVLLHELSHIRRWDVRTQLLAQAVCAVHWFNPFAWVAARGMRRERELACDDAVLTAGIPPVWYAAELLAMASDAQDRRAPAAALAMAHPSDMEGRLLAMLSDRPRCPGRAARALMPLMVACASVAVAGASTSGSAGVAASTAPSARPATVANWVLMPSMEGDDTLAEAHARDARTSPNPLRREQATLALAFTPGDTAIPGLLDALNDPDPHVREKAAVGLAWRRDPRIVPALLAAADDVDARVREKVIVALTFSGDARSDAAIERARTDPDPLVRDKVRTLSAPR